MESAHQRNCGLALLGPARLILPLFILPNSIHRFIPLDRVFKGVFKHYYNTELRECIGSGITPNTRVVLTCVSRTLDKISPDVTKAGWRGFYPYDRVGMIPVKEQKAAWILKTKTADGVTENDHTIFFSNEAAPVPNELRLHPLPDGHVYPSIEQTRYVLTQDFSQSDLVFHTDRLASPVTADIAVVEPMGEEEKADLDKEVPDLDELRERVGHGQPFRRQKTLGRSQKKFTSIGLITPEKMRQEQQRMLLVEAEEEAAKEAAREQKRQRALAKIQKVQHKSSKRGRPRKMIVEKEVQMEEFLEQESSTSSQTKNILHYFSQQSSE